MAAEGLQTAPRSRSRALATERAAPLQLGKQVDIVQRDGTTKTVYVGKLFIDQISGLSHWVRDTLKSSLDVDEGRVRQSLAQFLAAPTVASWALQAGAIEGFVDMLAVYFDESTLARPFSLILDEDEEWCHRNIGLTDFGPIFEALLDANNVSTVVTAFRRAAQRSSPPLSPPSSTGTDPSSTATESTNGQSGDTSQSG